MNKCGNCGFDARETWTCECCSSIVCETCMPVVGGDCLGCQLSFPALSPHMFREAMHAHACLDVRSTESSSLRFAISLDDHLGAKESHTHVLKKSQRQAQLPNSRKNKTPELVVDMVTSCLQQLGVAQAQSEHVIQNVKMCLDKIENAADESAPVSDPIRSVRKLSTDSGSSAERNSKKGKSTKKRGRTMMMCNIPCRVSHCDFIEALDSNGFGSCYEFVHLPCRYMKEESNLGYGFVHFFREADAERFALAFEGYHFSQKGSKKTCTVKIADCQGHDANAKRMPKKVRNAHRASP